MNRSENRTRNVAKKKRLIKNITIDQKPKNAPAAAASAAVWDNQQIRTGMDDSGVDDVLHNSCFPLIISNFLLLFYCTCCILSFFLHDVAEMVLHAFSLIGKFVVSSLLLPHSIFSFGL